MSIELESALDELYTAPREEFITRRRELAKTVRAAGDTGAAARIEKLAKPTIAAWLANRLSRTAPADVRALTKLGDALRDAHAQLDGEEIRSLTRRRSELIRTLLHGVEANAEDTLSESVIGDLEDIFARAVADDEVATALVAGRLTSPKAFASLAGWPSMPVAERSPKPHVKRPGKRAEQALKDARAEVKRAEATRSAGERSLADAESAATEATAQVKRLTEDLEAAEAGERNARGVVAKARRAVKEAERGTAQAWRRLQAAEAKLRA